MLPPSTSVVLNRCALISSLISRAAGLAVANGSVPSIRIVITRPARRSRIGTDRIWVRRRRRLPRGNGRIGEAAPIYGRSDAPLRGGGHEAVRPLARQAPIARGGKTALQLLRCDRRQLDRQALAARARLDQQPLARHPRRQFL